MRKLSFATAMKKTVFFRYLFSYLLLFLLPLLLGYILFQFHFIRIYKAEVIANHIAKGEMVSQVIDTNVKQINNILCQARMNTLMNPLKARDGLTQIKISDELKKTVLSNVLIKEINFLQTDLDVVISSHLVMKTNTLEKYHLAYNNWSKSDMLKDIYTTKTSFWRAFEPARVGLNKNSDILTGVFPLSVSNEKNANFLQIIIEKDTFSDIIGISEKSLGTFVITNKDGEILYSSKPLQNKFNFANFTAKEGETSSLFKEKGMIFTSYKSSENDWNYYNILPIKEALQMVYNTEMVYAFFFIFMISLGIFVIYFSMKKTYNPLRNLKKLIDGNLVKSTESVDEIKQAENAINHLNSMNNMLEERISCDSAKIKNECVFELFQGVFSTISEFNNKANLYGISFHGDYLFIVIVSYDGETENSNCYIEEKDIRDYYECYEVNFIHSFSKIFVCAAKDTTLKNIESDFNEIECKILEKTGKPVFIGISTLTFDLKNTYRKYVEAVIALENTHTDKVAVCVYGNNIYNYTGYYPSEEIKEMQRCILENDIEQFSYTFGVLEHYIENYDTSIFLRICVSYDIINALISKPINGSNHSIPQELVKQYILTSQNIYGNLSEHIEVMNMLKDYIIKELSKQATEDKLLKNIMAYIDLHYLDNDFSVQNVATYFSQNMSSLSIYFKSASGIMISQYITKLKMEYVLNLLKNSQETLTEIAQKAGYSTTSSFIRKFKQYTGMTPGDYKKTHGGDNIK